MTKNNARAVDKKTYKVVVPTFTDLEDNDKKYKKGDVYSTKDKSFNRIKELSSKNNKQGKVIIKEQD